jgi:hypothetical protein
MKIKSNMVWTVLVAGVLGVVVGCNKPGGADKAKSAAPEGAPANTTDSK